MREKYLISEVVNNAVIDYDNLNIQPVRESRPVVLKERRHAEFFDVIDSSLKIKTPEDFCAWAQGDLQHIFPHGTLIGCVGLIENETAQIRQLLTSNLPHEYLQAVQEMGGFNASPVLVQWLRTRRPVLFEMAAHNCKSEWLDNVTRHGLHNMAAHGLSDLNSSTTTYFSFSKIPCRLTQRHSKLLEMLVPHLHVALIRALGSTNKELRVIKTQLINLTGREQEVLHWLGSGKTNWEIAQVLQISEHTVKNHVQRILIKLKVNTRAQAVAKSLQIK